MVGSDYTLSDIDHNDSDTFLFQFVNYETNSFFWLFIEFIFINKTLEINSINETKLSVIVRSQRTVVAGETIL